MRFFFFVQFKNRVTYFNTTNSTGEGAGFNINDALDFSNLYRGLD
jgi:hypothetical protein